MLEPRPLATLIVRDYFRPELPSREAETPASAGFTGISTGAPLFLTKNTMNFAGLVLLAFRPTV